MQSLSKILLPIDFSERSVSAARCAKPLAKHFEAELILLHVLAPMQYQYGPAELGGALLSDLYANRAALAGQDMAGFLEHDFDGIRVTRVSRDGDPAQEIVAFAHEQSVDLIIMPTHGYGPFRRFILGSNTAKVLHDADCPVWTGIHMQHAPTPVTGQMRRILCAVDLGPQSEKALAWAAWLQKEFDAELTLLHTTGATPASHDPSQRSWRVHMLETVEEELTHLQHQAGCEAHVCIECGDPPQTICAAADRLQSDALVIGRGSAAGIYGRLRTNAYAIIRQSPCPVVSV